MSDIGPSVNPNWIDALFSLIPLFTIMSSILRVKARKVVALQKKLDAIKALLGPDAAPVDPSRVADILSAAGGGQAADE
jgi:hypothetical protein